MTPVSRCLQRVDHASVVTDTTVIAHVSDALNELENAYHRPSERIVALEEVLQNVARQRGGATPFSRFVRVSIERRQNKLARIVA